jgi:hypothetical protein
MAPRLAEANARWRDAFDPHRGLYIREVPRNASGEIE